MIRLALGVLLVSLTAIGCVTTNVSGSKENMVPDTQAQEDEAGSIPVILSFNGYEKFRYRGGFKGLVCAPFEYNFDFVDASKAAVAITMKNNFKIANRQDAATLIDLTIVETDGALRCRLAAVYGMYCTGSVSIHASLMIKAPNGRVSSEKFWSYSKHGEESWTAGCDAAAEETDKNFSSAFRKLMKKVVSDTKVLTAPKPVASAR